ncbi:MAG TPA: tyrosine-type recombinase/integrase [Pseudomonadales bacterium]|nr:tyrosine-type recombinase/integrase [Pseudomonadales bacterium]
MNKALKQQLAGSTLVDALSIGSNVAAPILTVVPKGPGSFTKVKDSRGREVIGLWERNGRYYHQMNVPGKGPRRIPLLDENGKAVLTVQEAVKAQRKLLMDRDQGKLPSPRRTRPFVEYVEHYVSWLQSTKAKDPKTIKKEASSLKGWAAFFGDTQLNNVTRKRINEYILQRTQEKDGEPGISNRTANLDVIALGNMLKFARDEGLLRGQLPTEDWKQLKYTPPKRSLISLGDIEILCAEAMAMAEGKPKHENGQFLADYIKLLAFSGARRQAGLSARWSQVDWANRQLTLFTKYDKTAVVDFNNKLEAHLKDMWARRDEGSPWIFPTPRPSEEGPGYFANPQKLLNEVKVDAELPNFTFHDLRHFFISYCVMSGIDTMTVAVWVQHADGGVLIGRVYGHLNPQHKRDAATKVQFTQREQELEIQARVADGIPENVVRTVSENCKTLKFQSQGFERD